MYIVSPAIAVAGHRPADADRVGLVGGRCTRRSSPTAGASVSSARVRRPRLLRRAERPGAGAARERARARRTSSAASEEPAAAASRLTIPSPRAPGLCRCARSAALRPVWYSCAMAATRSADVVELLGRVPGVLDARARRPRADRRSSRCRASSSPARSSSARATPATPATSCATATRARSARTATGARSRSRRSARATSSASWRCSRTSGARRPSRRSSRRASSAVLGPDMRRLMTEHPEISTRLVIALGPAPARDQRAALAPVLPDRAEPRRGRAQRAGRRRRWPTGKADGDGRAGHGHAGRPRPAGRLLARVGQPLPRGARARRRDLPGAGAARRPRPARRCKQYVF